MKQVCIYHSVDLDGWMSAAIVKYWHMVHLYTEPSTMDFIGWNYGNPIPDLSEYDKVIMVDIILPVEKMRELWFNLDKTVIWIDHHISAINDNNDLVWAGIQDVKFAACELTWKFFVPEFSMPEIVRLLGMYDSFRHKGTEEERKVLEFQYGARQAISNYEEAYSYLVQTIEDEKNGYTFNDDTSNIGHLYNKGVAIYQYLCTEAKQIYKNCFVVKLGDYYFSCVNRERFNPINFGINYHDEKYDGFACFHYANGKFYYSLYNDNGQVDVSEIAKAYGGGGHKGAAGFISDVIIK